MLFRSLFVVSFAVQKLLSFIRSHLCIFVFISISELGLCCCTRAFSSCGERGLLFVAVRGLLISVVSLVVEHGLLAHGLQ